MAQAECSKDRFRLRPRPRHLKRDGGGPSALHLLQVRAWLRGGGRTKRTALGRRPRLAVPPASLQRSVVKIRYVGNRSGNHWRAHGRYLARESAQEGGRPGLGFDANADGIDIGSLLAGWQRAGDPRLWKLIVSPDEGHRLDLRWHARELVATLEGDLGVHLEWVSIEHHDTAHPHVHIVVRGQDGEGHELRMPRNYIAHGIRMRSQELATRVLGLRTEHDRVERERRVEARRFGILDRILEERADGARIVAFEAGVPAAPLAREARLEMLQRLGFLTEIGLAERTGKRTWRLYEHHRSALREMQLVRDLQRSLSRAGRPIAEPGAPQRFAQMRAGVDLQGRVAGVAFDDVAEVSYVVLEGTDGVTRFLRETPEIARSRATGALSTDEIVTLRGRAAMSSEVQGTRVEIAVHGTLQDLEAVAQPATILDLAALRSVRVTGEVPAGAPTGSGFFAAYQEAVRRRVPLLERHGLVRWEANRGAADQEWRLTIVRDAEVRIELAMKQREMQPLTFAEAARLSGKPVEKGRLEVAAVYRGRVVATARDDAGENYLVLDTGRTLTAVLIGAEQHFAMGREVRAMAEEGESRVERGRVLGWVLEEMEREQKRDRGRER